MSDVTRLLDAVERGEPEAAEELLPLVYGGLRRLAAARMAKEKAGQTLQATALVHEAWLRIPGGGKGRFASRQHFFKAAAKAMQRILIDNARRKRTLKHDAGTMAQNLEVDQLAVQAPAKEILAVSEALERLAAKDPQATEVVRLRYFVGMTVPEIADVLGLAPRTVDRQWAFARAWLKRAIRSSLGGEVGPS